MSSKRAASRMVSEGLLSGIPDLFLPAPFPPYSGLYIEMKHLSGRYARGKSLSQSQSQTVEDLRLLGYRVEECWSSGAAIEKILSYVVSGMSNHSRRERAKTKAAALQALLAINPDCRPITLVSLPDPGDSPLVGLEQAPELFIDFVQSNAFESGVVVKIHSGTYRLSFDPAPEEGRPGDVVLGEMAAGIARLISLYGGLEDG